MARPVVPPGRKLTARPVVPPGRKPTARPVVPPGRKPTARPVVPPGRAGMARPPLLPCGAAAGPAPRPVVAPQHEMDPGYLPRAGQAVQRGHLVGTGRADRREPGPPGSRRYVRPWFRLPGQPEPCVARLDQRVRPRGPGTGRDRPRDHRQGRLDQAGDARRRPGVTEAGRDSAERRGGPRASPQPGERAQLGQVGVGGAGAQALDELNVGRIDVGSPVGLQDRLAPRSSPRSPRTRAGPPRGRRPGAPGPRCRSHRRAAGRPGRPRRHASGWYPAARLAPAARARPGRARARPRPLPPGPGPRPPRPGRPPPVRAATTATRPADTARRWRSRARGRPDRIAWAPSSR